MFPNTRLRRTRMYDWSRRLIQENNITTSDLILPLFIKEGKNVIEEIKSMPDVYKYSIDTLKKIIKEAIRYKIPAVALFPEINNNKKNEIGSEALNKNNLICNAVREIKKSFGNSIGVICDVALDPYTSHGHDGIVKKNIVDNDETIKILIEQSLNQAEAGCDILAPSDMMDGRIGEIRKSLEKNNYKNIQLLSYAAKYASNFYGPFRNAVGRYNLKTDLIEIANAGHQPALLKNGKEFKEFPSSAMPLAVVKHKDESIYKLESFNLNKGRIYCFTDGFSECRNEKKQEIGIVGVKELILKHENSSLKKVLLLW